MFIYKAAYSTPNGSIRHIATCALPVPTQFCAFLLTDSEAPNVPLHSAASSEKDTSPTPAEIRSLKSHLLLDLRNRQPRIQAFGACPRAIQNSMTPIQTHTIIQGRLPLLLLFIPAIRQPPITLQQHRGSQILL